MKKNKLIIGICLALSVVGFTPTVDAAYNATIEYQNYNFNGKTSTTTGLQYSVCGNGSTYCPKGSPSDYKVFNQYIKMNGKSYKSWCIDPGLHAYKNAKYSCSPFQDGGIAYLFEQANKLENTVANETMISLAFRFYAIYTGYGMVTVDSSGNAIQRDNLTGIRGALIRYLQFRDPVTYPSITASFTNGTANQFLSGNDAIVEQAYNLANEAKKRQTNLSTLPTNKSLTYSLITSDPEKVVLNVSSSSYIDRNNIEFSCKQGTDAGSCQKVEYDWKGNSGTITVYTNCLLKQTSRFGIVARFKQNGVYACYPEGGNHQIVMTFINDGNPIEIPYENYNPKCDEPDEPDEPDSKCCVEDPINPSDIEGAVENCCVETTHSYANEYDLDELFCHNNELNIDHYWLKCNADHFLNENLKPNEYCDLYCTERVTIDVPEAITAKSGRYFTLSKNPNPNATTTSPYIEGYKRCRTIIKYDEWEKDYILTVREQIKAYNDYQYYMAFVESYNSILNSADKDIEGNNKKTPFNAKVKCTATATTVENCLTKYKNPITGEISDTYRPGYVSFETGGGTATTSWTKTDSCTINYVRLNTNVSAKPYYYAQIKSDNRSDTNPIVNNHGDISLSSSSRPDGYANFNELKQTDKNSKKENPTYIATEVEDKACDTTVPDDKKTVTVTTTSGCSKSGVPVTCYIEYPDGFKDFVYNKKENTNFDTIYTDYTEKANAAKKRLESLIANAQVLKKKLTDCNSVFEDKPAEEVYKFDPTMTFKYSQIYRTDKGKSVLEEISIPFMDNTPGCKISAEIGNNINYDGGMDTAEDKYSSVYGNGTINVSSFSIEKLKYNNGNNINSMIDLYTANKRFTHDARYKAVCEWQEKENTVNTLVPNGAVTETATSNITIHDREYKVYLTTYDGTFETKWSLTNVGENGKFDDYIKNHGTNTCSGNAPSDENTFSCTLHIEQEIPYTGKCNDVADDPEDCDPVPNVEGFFQFKVADPANLFPTGTTDNNGKTYARNWTDDKGLRVKEEIEEQGAKGETYDEKKSTYKFHLTPSDMRHIKNYNVTRNANGIGGYSDFNMTCDCPSEHQTNTAIAGGVGCTKCKSNLLNDLVEGHIYYNSQNYSVNVWTANKSIDQIRNATWR